MEAKWRSKEAVRDAKWKQNGSKKEGNGKQNVPAVSYLPLGWIEVKWRQIEGKWRLNGGKRQQL